MMTRFERLLRQAIFEHPDGSGYRDAALRPDKPETGEALLVPIQLLSKQPHVFTHAIITYLALLISLLECFFGGSCAPKSTTHLQGFFYRSIGSCAEAS